MKNILLILLLTFPLCHAQPQESLAVSNCDSLEVAVGNLNKSQKEIKNSIDSIAIKAIEKSQEFYKNSFAEIQNSFSNFLTAIGIVIGLLAIFISALVLVNFKSVNNSKKEFKKINGKISNLERSSGEKFEEQLENQKKLLEEIKRESETAINDLRKQIAKSSFEGAASTYNVRNTYNIGNIEIPHMKSHLIQLNSYFTIIADSKLELNIDDLLSLEKIGRFIKDYNYIPESFVQFFSAGLKKFIDYCKVSEKRKFIKKEDEQALIEKVKKIWQVFLERFDNGDINNLIEDYKKMSLNDRIIMEYNAMRDFSNKEVRRANDH